MFPQNPFMAPAGGSGGGEGGGGDPPPSNPVNYVTVTPGSEKRELRLNQPDPYDGTKAKLRPFLQACYMYLLINKLHYKTDNQKITFVLSFMTEGEVIGWREAWIEDHIKGTKIKWGSYQDFLKDLTKAFSEVDEQGSALTKLDNMTQGADTADDFVSKFKIILAKTGLLDNKWHQAG